jgi:nicotinate-nucleotide adenylyltransferase
MGSDSFQNISNWKNYEMLIRDYSLYIYQRPKFVVQESSPNIHLLHAPLLEISSTAIREAIRKEKSIRYLVPDKVREEIEKSNYYK